MSFSTDCKKEITGDPPKKPCCRRALLCGVLAARGEVNSGTVTVYADTLQGGEWNCVSVLRVPELTEEWTEAANDAITDILTGESGQATIYAYVNMISIFCVDRITPAFRSLVNSNMEQGFKNGRLVVGVSFGGKRIYVARQVGGMFIVKYKKLRRELARILELQEIKS